MKRLLNLEELGILLLSIVGFAQLPYAWWYYPALLLIPDIGMIGYLAGSRAGAFCYNLCHHRLLASAFLVLGLLWSSPEWLLAGTITFGHISMDRLLGYGLKFNDSFHHTHLGWLKNTASAHDQK